MSDLLAASALPAAVAAYERALESMRAARADLIATLRAAEDSAAPFFGLDTTADSLAFLACGTSREAIAATALSSMIFDSHAEEGRSIDDLEKIMVAGSARWFAGCKCGTCGACAIAAPARAAGEDPIAALLAASSRAVAPVALAPSGLVTPDGAPLASSPAPSNRHQRRAQASRAGKLVS